MSAAYFRGLAAEAAARYPRRDRYAYHHAFGKLTRDPVFAHLLSSGALGSGGTILDLGCGQGLLGALLARAEARADWPADWPAAPRAWRMLGIDLMAKDIDRARQADIPNARFVAGDIREADFGKADTAVILDVLHYLDMPAQLEVLARVRAALQPTGTLLVRVADAAGGWRFRITEAMDVAVTRLRGHRVGRLHSVPLAERIAQLEGLGFRVAVRPMSEGTPFANVLLSARYDSRAPS